MCILILNAQLKFYMAMGGRNENMHQAVKQKITVYFFCPLGMKSIPLCSHSSIKITDNCNRQLHKHNAFVVF